MSRKTKVEKIIKNLNDNFATVRQEAARALGFIRSGPSVEALIGALADKDRFVGKYAKDSLVHIGKPAVGPLMTALNHTDPHVRILAEDALVEIGDMAVEPLILALKSPEFGVRQHAVDCLGRMGVKESIDELIDTLRDENDDVCHAASAALRKIVHQDFGTSYNRWKNWYDQGGWKWATEDKQREKLNRHIKNLHNENANIRRSAAEDLGELGDPRAVHSLIDALQDDSWDVRRTAAHALGLIGTPETVAPLIEALADTNYDVRAQATRALRRIGEPTHEALAVAIGQKDSHVRKHAALALGGLGDKRSFDALIEGLHDRDILMSANAAMVLGELGDRRAVLPLIESLRESTWDHSKDVPKALKTLTGKDFGASYDRWRNWWDAEGEAKGCGSRNH